MAVDLNRFQVRSALRVNFPLCPGDLFLNFLRDRIDRILRNRWGYG
jgi:hypothetical protein